MASAVTMFRLVGLVAIVMISSSEAIPCDEVYKDIASCANFIMKGDVEQPSENCCNGVKDLYQTAKTKAVRVEICECIKKELVTITYDPNRIPLLPKACGISDLTLPSIDKNTDCNEIALIMM